MSRGFECVVVVDRGDAREWPCMSCDNRVPNGGLSFTRNEVQWYCAQCISVDTQVASAALLKLYAREYQAAMKAREG